jgi:hypothetical protein
MAWPAGSFQSISTLSRPPPRRNRRTTGTPGPPNPINKSFLVLFFKKEQKEELLFEERSKNLMSLELRESQIT